MRLFPHLFRLLLILSLALIPVQGVFAGQTVQADIQTGSPVVASNIVGQNCNLQMLENNCGTHDDGTCQSSASCGSCSMSLASAQISPLHSEIDNQILAAISNASLYNAHLTPDYRPPRYS